MDACLQAVGGAILDIQKELAELFLFPVQAHFQKNRGLPQNLWKGVLAFAGHRAAVASKVKLLQAHHRIFIDEVDAYLLSKSDAEMQNKYKTFFAALVCRPLPCLDLLPKGRSF